MKHLKIIIKKHKALMLLYLAMGITLAFLQSFVARYFQTVIDHFTSSTLTLSNIVIYGAAMIALYVLSYLDEYPDCKLEHAITLSLKTNALKKVSVIDYLSYVKLGTGTLIQRIENGACAGTSILKGFYLRLMATLIPEIIFSISFIFVINRSVMVAILVGYAVVFVVSRLLLKALYKVKANILVNEEKFNRLLVRGFMEMVVFRVNRRFAHEIEKIQDASNEIVASKVKMKLIHEAFFAIFAVLIGFVKIGVIVYGWVAKTLTVGEIVALIALVDNAYQPIAIFNVLYVEYKLDVVAFDRYTDFLDAKEDARLTHGEQVPGIKGNLSLSNISFGYKDRDIFSNLSLDINQGTTTALVGESGCGKSTAVKLLAGLLHPTRGRITLDGHDLKCVNLNSYYENIAYLPQEPSVFDGSLRENLVFDQPVSDAALINALGQVGLGPLYSKLENRLDTQLGEKGVSLSGGERQQLALARLWFSKASLVLLDEATSAIDNLTQDMVMKNVMHLLAGKTVIAIAHRLDSIKGFDNIVVLQNGRIIEQGTFDALLKRRQHFYELYNRATA